VNRRNDSRSEVSNRAAAADGHVSSENIARGELSMTSSVAVGYINALGQTIGSVSWDVLDRLVDVLLEARSERRRVFVMGNGGSAATASHMVADLMKTAQVDGFAPLRAYSLTDSVPAFTAWSNDTSYSFSFAGQIRAQVETGDVVMAISASGNSPNIIEGLHEARALNALTIGLLGFDGGRALDMVDIAIHIPCFHYGLVEDLHLAIGHAVTAAIRTHLEKLSERLDGPAEESIKLSSALDLSRIVAE
jgi:D-sedoheptulose 7-phosphate isomerase